MLRFVFQENSPFKAVVMGEVTRNTQLLVVDKALNRLVDRGLICAHAFEEIVSLSF